MAIETLELLLLGHSNAQALLQLLLSGHSNALATLLDAATAASEPQQVSGPSLRSGLSYCNSFPPRVTIRNATGETAWRSGMLEMRQRNDQECYWRGHVAIGSVAGEPL